MKSIAKFKGVAPAIGLSLFLVSCNANKNPFEVTITRCPAVAIMGYTGDITLFEGEGRDRTDVAYTALMSNVKSTCSQGTDVEGKVSFMVSAMKGPAAQGDTVTIPYFVTVIRDNNLVVAKKIYNLTLTFGPDSLRAQSMETISSYIPEIEQARRYDYELLVGFQLSDNEVVYNLLR